MQLPMTEVISTRSFRWSDEPERIGFLRLGRPAQTPGIDPVEFYCPIQTDGFGDKYDEVKCVHGVDAFQALELAVQYSRWQVSFIDNENGGKLRWLDEPIPADWALRPE